jgi:SsrA-binding protein
MFGVKRVHGIPHSSNAVGSVVNGPFVIYTSSMAKKPTPPAKKKGAENHKTITENRKARHEYEVLDTLECGLMLLGSEVKSLRNGKVSLDEAYGRVKDDGVWLVGCEIPEYTQATIWNHAPKRPRKLLIHKRELLKFAAKAKEKGLTLVPLKLYFTERGFAKVLLGLCRGKKLHDKRETMKKADMKRDMDRAMRRG